MRAVKISGLILAGLIAAILFIGYGVMRSSLPQTAGTVTLPGLTSPVTVARDAHGVPHISAANAQDLFFAQGYVHAQDRLWQMDFNRRVGSGRLAEVMGPAVLDLDKYFRTLGFRSRAESAYAHLNAEAQAMLKAYAAGVNAFLDTRRGALPPEFMLLGAEPDPWSPVDTMVWQKMMWLDLSGNMGTELARARALMTLPPEKVASLYPTYPGDSEAPLPALADIFEDLPVKQLSEGFMREKPAGYGSNNWVVDGSLTTTGKPLLANDPHLGLSTPSIWYLVRLHNRALDENVVGVSFPGSPGVVLGRNDRFAWGFTNTAPDIQDLYVEKQVGDTQYLTPDGPADFITREEVIKIRGQADVTLTVRETRHGPVVSDVVSAARDVMKPGYLLSLRWTALDAEDSAAIGIARLNGVQNFEDFKAAGRYYFGPQQNMIYADVDGNIGYHAPARVPVRRPDNPIGGRLPSPGWDALYDWQGFIPYEDLPTRYNPDGGLIATANEKIVANGYPHFITRDWSLPYRGNRIRHLLRSAAPHDTDSFMRLHMDTVSDMVRDVKPWLLALAPQDNPLVAGLKAWDGDMAADRYEPLIFQTWLLAFQEKLIADELGDDLYPLFRRLKPRLLKSALYWSGPMSGGQMAGDPADTDAYFALPVLDKDVSLSWCDNVTTGDRSETCNMLVADALGETLIWLNGGDVADDTVDKVLDNVLNNILDNVLGKQKWGDSHILTQAHRPFSQIPLIGNFFHLKGAQGGGRYTINVAGSSADPDTLHASGFGPSYRGIFDLSDLDKSLYVQPTGQSGHPLSPHYDDLFPLWREGRYIRIPTDRPVPDGSSVLTLQPSLKPAP